jgi:electron transport complex protein RnfD
MQNKILGLFAALAILAGGIYLLATRTITWHIPTAYVGTVCAMSLLTGRDPIAQVLSGGLLLGAFFMATDYTTSPVNFKGQVIFAIGCGLITSVIRLFGSLPEGVSFSIIIMNILVPQIEKFTTPKPFGTVKEKKVKEAAK